MVVRRIINRLPSNMAAEGAAALAFAVGMLLLFVYAVLMGVLWPWLAYMPAVALTQFLWIPVWIAFAVAFELRIMAAKKSAQ